MAGISKSTVGTALGSHSERVLSFLESGEASDFTILAGKDKTPIRVQKLFLMMGSPILSAQVATAQVEAQIEQKTPTMEMPEMTKEEAMLFLKFLYTGEKPDDVDSALPILEIADTYKIPDLAKHCAELLETKLSNKSVIQIYEQARRFDNEHLKKSTMTYICENAANIILSEEFLQVSMGGLEKILEEDSLAVLDELQLFEAVLSWASAEIGRKNEVVSPTSLRSVLETIIPLIRFPTMTRTEFAMKVATSQVLSMEEIITASLYYDVPEPLRSSMALGLFNAKRRHYYIPSGTKYTATKRQTHILTDFMFQHKGAVSNLSCSIKFKTNFQIWIRHVDVDFGVSSSAFGSNVKKCEFHVRDTDVLEIIIEDCEQQRVLLTKKANFSGLENNILTISFDSDLPIKNDVQYCLTFRISTILYRERRYESRFDEKKVTVKRMTDKGKEVPWKPVVFEFEEMESKLFFEQFSMQFFLN